MENSPLAAKSRIQNMNFVKKITYGNLKFERRIHDFPDWEGGANLWIWCKNMLFAENCVKMKEFGSRGGVRVPSAPLDRPQSQECLNTITWINLHMNSLTEINFYLSTTI